MTHSLPSVSVFLGLASLVALMSCGGSGSEIALVTGDSGAGAGGDSTGGSATGGSATGGSATGGSATGGAATGGVGTGGSGTGGSGAAEPGDPCDWDAECLVPEGADGAGCDSFADSCYAEYRVALGDACSFSCWVRTDGGSTCYRDGGSPLPVHEHAQCWEEDSLYCSSQHACAALAAPGESCERIEYTTTCQGEYYCAAGTSGNTCQPKLAIGETCGGHAPCISTAYCEQATSKCAAKKASGEPCTYSFECSSECYTDPNTQTDVCK
jgi:hypothetical protein